MSEKRFAIGEHLPALSSLTGAGLTREPFVTAMLELMLTMGFERARFYERAEDVVREEPVLVLVEEVPKHPEDHRGYTVDFKESTIARQKSGLMPAVDTAVEPEAIRAETITKLDLKARSWVEIPVTEGETVAGVIALDWIGRPNLIDKEDKEALRIVGAQVGSHLGLKPIKALEEYREASAEWFRKEKSPDKLVQIAADYLAGALDAAATAVFELSWTDQRLTKVYEHFPKQLCTRVADLGELRESYSLGENLTGQAWEPAGYHHIVDFGSLDELGALFVARESREWHINLLGELHSVVYTVLGALDQRYLVRMINRHRRPELPFLSEVALLESLASELRSDLDTAVANKRLKSLTKIAEMAADTKLTPTKISQSVEKELEEEKVEDLCVICHQEDRAQFGFGNFLGARLRGVEFDLDAEWGSDRLYSTALEGDGVLPLAPFYRRSPLADLLRERGFKAIMSFMIRSGQTCGAFFVPLSSGVMRKRDQSERFTPPPGCSFGTVSLLHAYTRLVANAVETRSSREREEGARDALGLIGHEIGAPLSIANSAAEEALNNAEQTIREFVAPEVADRAVAQIDQYREELWDRQKAVGITLDLARLVSQDSKGEIQLYFKPASLYSILREAVEQVQIELDLERSGRLYQFNFSPAVRRLGRVTCDPFYLVHVFKNLIRNAVKYSISSGGGMPMPIDVFAEPQSRFVAVKVRNWGLGVPEARKDLIFQPWVRGGLEDPKKAIRGMGLGLYLAQRIVSAHRGSILFTSEPTYGDRRRLENMEGFETVFEVRIPRNLAPGTYTHLPGGHRVALGGE